MIVKNFLNDTSVFTEKNATSQLLYDLLYIALNDAYLGTNITVSYTANNVESSSYFSIIYYGSCLKWNIVDEDDFENTAFVAAKRIADVLNRQIITNTTKISEKYCLPLLYYIVNHPKETVSVVDKITRGDLKDEFDNLNKKEPNLFKHSLNMEFEPLSYILARIERYLLDPTYKNEIWLYL